MLSTPCSLDRFIISLSRNEFGWQDDVVLSRSLEEGLHQSSGSLDSGVGSFETDTRRLDRDRFLRSWVSLELSSSGGV